MIEDGKSCNTKLDDKNIVNIFENCKFDVDAFLEKYPETRCLSEQEIIAVHSYCETGKKYDFVDTILGCGRSSCYKCIFKIEDGRWIVWENDERKGFYNSAKIFNTVTEACYYLISLQKNINEEQCKDFFSNLLKCGMSSEEMIQFSHDFNYTISTQRIRNNCKV